MIQVEHNPQESRIKALDARSWPIWTCEVSEFAWTYDSKETCYILEGEVTVTPDGGESVTIKAGDLVVFPAGMSCRWNVVKPIKKHYQFA
ncbi:MAG: cupin domain-containing protein [Deltaproteobacteria bacterium]|nr:cupin domain-containing protein [Deltaproteobacteria bacterium]